MSCCVLPCVVLGVVFCLALPCVSVIFNVVYRWAEWCLVVYCCVVSCFAVQPCVVSRDIVDLWHLLGCVFLICVAFSCVALCFAMLCCALWCRVVLRNGHHTMLTSAAH